MTRRTSPGSAAGAAAGMNLYAYQSQIVRELEEEISSLVRSRHVIFIPVSCVPLPHRVGWLAAAGVSV